MFVISKVRGEIFFDKQFGLFSQQKTSLSHNVHAGPCSIEMTCFLCMVKSMRNKEATIKTPRRVDRRGVFNYIPDRNYFFSVFSGINTSLM